MRKQNFTLIEIMAALTVLVIMMGFLFRFIISSQALWDATDRGARTYADAQTFFEIFGRDLQGAIASDDEGAKIPFWVGSSANDSYTASRISFVTTSSSGSDPSLYHVNAREIHYACRATPGSKGESHFLRRSCVEANDSLGNANSQWDFYNDETTTTPPTWVGTDGTYQELIDGVYYPTTPLASDVGLQIVCYGKDGTQWTANSVHYELPTAVKVTVELVDYRLLDSDLPTAAKNKQIDSNKRKFTKTFFLAQ